MLVHENSTGMAQVAVSFILDKICERKEGFCFRIEQIAMSGRKNGDAGVSL